MTPRHPIELAAELKAPVLGLYGAADQGIALESIERMRAACKANSKECEIVVYPDTPHAFNADYRPSYRPEAAKDGWGRMFAWFRTHWRGLISRRKHPSCWTARHPVRPKAWSSGLA